MSELMTVPAHAATTCPAWCVHEGTAADHAHQSHDVTAGAGERPLTARLVHGNAAVGPQVVVNGQVAELRDFAAFVAGLHHLLGQVQLAPAGLGYVEDLLRDTGVTLGEVAEAADLDVAWVRAQHAGAQMLSVSEFDRLALAVAVLTVSSTAAS